jgi:hypothetical protein
MHLSILISSTRFTYTSCRLIPKPFTKMMLKTRTCTLALALLTMAVFTPAHALLRGSAPVADNSTAKAKAATGIDRFQTLIAKKAPWGIYDAADWSTADGKLHEGSKNGKDVVSEGTIKYGSGAGNGAKGDVSFISGGTTSRLDWPEGSMPTSYTICSITRYIGGTTGRILVDTTGEWFLGHWQGRVGKAYSHEWKTEIGPRTDDTNWAVMCGNNGLPTPKNILYNGAPVGIASGGGTSGLLGVNPARGISNQEISDWALSFVAIWDQHLTAEEMQTASDALMEYLATGRSLVVASTDATPSSNTITTVSGPSTVSATTMGPCNVMTTTIASNATTTTTTTTVNCPEEAA